MDRTLLIDDVEVFEYDLYYATIPLVPTPERDVEHVEIRGRHGSLTKKYGYKDILYPIEFYFYENRPFKKAFRKAKMFLINAKKLSFKDDSDVYYKIKSLQIREADNDIYKYGRFTADFVLDPFQYEISNESQTITSQTTITNFGYEADPIIIVHCSGTGKVYINDREITIQNINGTITIDSDMKNAYRIANGYITNLNHHMIGEFPVLEHGDNVIDFDGDIERLEVIPNRRWV